MDIKLKEVPIQKLVDKFLGDNKITKAEVSRRLGKDQSYFIRKYIKKGLVNVDELINLSKILDHNFFADYCDYSQDENEVMEAAQKYMSITQTEIWNRYNELVVKVSNMEKENARLNSLVKEYREKLGEEDGASGKS